MAWLFKTSAIPDENFLGLSLPGVNRMLQENFLWKKASRGVIMH